MASARRTAWRWALLVALVAAAYAAVLRADFVNWDDPIDVYANPRVVATDWFRRSWSDGRTPGFYPVLYAVYRAEWLAGSQQPWLFHLDSVLLHAGNALLVGALAGELGLPAGASWLAAGLWALHPAQVESVAWVTERKNILYTAFWLGALLLHLRSRRATGSRAAGLYGASLLLFCGSLLSKGAAITLPAAVVLVEWSRGERLDRRAWLGLLPYVVLALAGGIGLMNLVPPSVVPPPLGVRLVIACRAFWAYLGTFLWPLPLVPVYAKWSVAPLAPGNVLAALGVTVLVALGCAAWRRVPRVLLCAAGLFVVNIGLVLGVVWNSYGEIAFTADRYLYLPSVGLAIAAVVGLGDLARVAGLPSRAPDAATAIWCAALALLTWRQVPVWHDSETLWSHALAHNDACRPCHENLGLILAGRDDLTAAAGHYEAALRLGVREEGLLGLCSVRIRQRRVEDAAPLCEAGLRLNPASPTGHRMLGVIRAAQHRLDEAAEQYGAALRLALDGAGIVIDGIPGLVNDFAGVLLEQGRTGDAIRVLEQGVAREPQSAMLFTSLSWIRATNADPAWRDGAVAVRLAERACALTAQRDVDALEALAAAQAETGRFGDAVRAARQALALTDGRSPRARQIAARLALYEAGAPYRE